MSFVLDRVRRWFSDRGLLEKLTFDAASSDCLRFNVDPSVPAVKVEEFEDKSAVAFHGSWWYALWCILDSGILCQSYDESMGHEFWQSGVYCSPCLDTAKQWYADCREMALCDSIK